MTLTAKILLQILATESSSSDLSSTTRVTNVSRTVNFASGTGANQAQIVWSDSRTIAADATDFIEFANLDDDRGALAISALKLIYVRNTGTVLIVAPVGDPNIGGISVPPGGTILLANPSAAGWGNQDIDQTLAFANASITTAATYDIILIGEGGIGS